MSTIDTLDTLVEDFLDQQKIAVVGGPMIMGWHRTALSFLRRNRQTWGRVPLAVFMTAMSLTDTDKTRVDGVRVHVDGALPKAPRVAGKLSFRERYARLGNYVRPILRAARPAEPASIGVFGGRLEYGRLPWWGVLVVMLVIQAPAGNRRNWEEIHAWAKTLPGAMGLHAPAEVATVTVKDRPSFDSRTQILDTSVMSKVSQLSKALQAGGYRVTRARQAIFRALVDSGGHVSADEIVAAVHRQEPSVGRMTVYRTLDLLRQLGLVQPVYQGTGAAHYILMEGGHHHHIICSNCDRVVEFDECMAQEMGKLLGERFEFQIQGHLLEFYGVCADCQDGS